MRTEQTERSLPGRIARLFATLLMIRILPVALMLALLSLADANADGVVLGPDCTITINPPTTGAAVDGYRLYYGATPGARTLSVDLGLVTQATCSAQGIPDGQIYMIVLAYNIVGEGAESVEFPFVLVTGLPGAPGIQVSPRAP